MVKKDRSNFSADPVILKNFKETYPEPVSNFIENQMRNYLETTDDIEVLESMKRKLDKEIREKTERTLAIQEKICTLRNEKQKTNKITNKLKNITETTITRILENQSGIIGENQIRQVAEAQKIEYKELIEYLLSKDLENINIIKEYLPPKTTKKKNGLVLK